MNPPYYCFIRRTINLTSEFQHEHEDNMALKLDGRVYAMGVLFWDHFHGVSIKLC
jgi:hypothetical protein